MIKLCEKMNIKDFTIDAINQTLNKCEECCENYFKCDVVLKLNDKLKELED